MLYCVALVRRQKTRQLYLLVLVCSHPTDYSSIPPLSISIFFSTDGLNAEKTKQETHKFIAGARDSGGPLLYVLIHLTHELRYFLPPNY